MNKGKIYGLCCGLENEPDEDTIEAYIATPMDGHELSLEWYDYYWSPKYKDVDVFIKYLKDMGIVVVKLKEVPAEFIRIEVV